MNSANSVGRVLRKMRASKNMSPRELANKGILSFAQIQRIEKGSRDRIKMAELPPKEPLVIFDEIHKFVRWRGLVKGLYDKYHDSTQFLITGSARLDYFRKGGDSLLGRYHHYRLHPFSLREVSARPTLSEAMDLFQFGGFPEPYLATSQVTLKRWQKERRQRIIYDDLRDLALVKEASLLDLLVDILPSRVGSPLSIKRRRRNKYSTFGIGRLFLMKGRALKIWWPANF
jgi:predicted AAA+ superfamily ATPase